MFKKIFVSLLFAAGVISAANAQFRKIPAVVTDSFKAKYANAESVSWSDKLSSFQADFKINGKDMKSTFSSKGEWQKTESKTDFASLPNDVKDGFKKSKYADMSVVDISLIDDKEKGTEYRIQVKKNDYSKKSLVFSKTGQLLKDGTTL